MVWTKARARRPLISLSDPCSSGSNPGPSSSPYSLFLGEIVKNMSTSKITVNQLAIRDPPTGGVFSTFDDFWVNTKYFFVKKSPSINQTFYCMSLRYSYKNRHEAGRPGPYDKSDFDRAFSRMVIGKSPYHLKDKFSSLPLTEMNRVVRAAFHPYSEISARWPEPEERIYDRLVGGYIGVWLEHLRSGWNPRCH